MCRSQEPLDLGLEAGEVTQGKEFWFWQAHLCCLEELTIHLSCNKGIFCLYPHFSWLSIALQFPIDIYCSRQCSRNRLNFALMILQTLQFITFYQIKNYFLIK